MPDIWNVKRLNCLHASGQISAHLVLGALACLSGASCCSTPKKAPEPVWIPRPRVEWNRLVAQAPSAVNNEFKIVAEGTSGLFPANLAVTRVAISEGEDAGAPMLFADPRNEFLQWNRTFDDQMAISEVFPIDQRDLGGGVAEPAQILAAFRGLHARLGLIYAVNEVSPTQAEMFGVFYDTHASRPVAFIHADAQSVPLTKEEQETANPWETDSRALVRAKFEKFAYAAVHRLIVGDQRERTDPPEGWTPAGPIRPVEWPPRQKISKR